MNKKNDKTREYLLHHMRLYELDRFSPTDVASNDLRKFNPTRTKLDLDGRYSGFKVARSNKQSGKVNLARLSYTRVTKNPICIKRASRRRALFKLGLAGKIKVRVAKWGSNSRISCKG